MQHMAWWHDMCFLFVVPISFSFPPSLPPSLHPSLPPRSRMRVRAVHGCVMGVLWVCYGCVMGNNVLGVC